MFNFGFVLQGHHEEVFAGIEERKQKILAQRKAAEKWFPS